MALKLLFPRNLRFNFNGRMTRKSEVLEYLEKLPEKERIALDKLRSQVQALVPMAEEGLSRGVPFFYYLGKRVVGFRSSKKHLSFFIMDGRVLKDFHDKLETFDHSSTVLRFTADKPLPEALIAQLVRARISEIDHQLTKKT